MRGREKPHLRCKGGVWSCCTFREEFYDKLGCYLTYWRVGFGYSVREACADWKEQEFA